MDDRTEALMMIGCYYCGEEVEPENMFTRVSTVIKCRACGKRYEVNEPTSGSGSVVVIDYTNEGSVSGVTARWHPIRGATE